MAIKIVGPIKELTWKEKSVGWISSVMDDSINTIFQKENFEKEKSFNGVDMYIPEFCGYSFAKRWVLDTENIRSDWFKHE